MFVAPLLIALAAAAAPAPTSVPRGTEAGQVPLDFLPALKGGYFALRSKAVGRVYHIYVRVPEEYAKAPGRHWPIVYLLDGDSAFPMLAPEHLFLHYDEGLEDAIVVGIAYGSFDPAVNKRDVDFLDEPATPGGTAGAAAFSVFLKDELLPEVERRFRGDPARRVLVGQSYGGTYVLYSALTDPDLFRGRIASNPSFRYGRARLFAGAAAGARKDLGLVLVSGERNNGPGRQGAAEWFAAWQGRKDAPWAVKKVDLPGGTHAADLTNAYRAGMLWLFRDGQRGAPR
ncbi:MAG TPA: alpha/beta hydrolase-fold protein [Allosphingosinicella sp.]|jgi:predicted alpha/beta superfamily hydrolase